MFENPGKQMKILSYIILGMMVLLGLIMAFAFSEWSFPIVIGCTITGYTSGLCIYAFGQFVDDIHSIKEGEKVEKRDIIDDELPEL